MLTVKYMNNIVEFDTACDVCKMKHQTFEINKDDIQESYLNLLMLMLNNNMYIYSCDDDNLYICKDCLKKIHNTGEEL